MCLAVPMKVLNIEGEFALAESGGLKKRINVQLLKSLKIGEYVIVHAGFAIQKIDTKDAQKTLRELKKVRL